MSPLLRAAGDPEALEDATPLVAEAPGLHPGHRPLERRRADLGDVEGVFDRFQAL